MGLLEHRKVQASNPRRVRSTPPPRNLSLLREKPQASRVPVSWFRVADPVVEQPRSSEHHRVARTPPPTHWRN